MDHSERNPRAYTPYRPVTPQPYGNRPHSRINHRQPNPWDHNNFLATLDSYVNSTNMQSALVDALLAPPKRAPSLSSPNFSYSKCLAEARRHIVTIFRSRGPITNDEVANPLMKEVVFGPMTTRVWSLVYELVDLEKGIGESMEKERMKSDLVQELVECVKWDAGMDAQWEASRLVEDIFPLQLS